MAKPKVNFVKYMNRFDAKEKAVLCNLVRNYGSLEFADVHQGLLPFLNIEVIYQSLYMATLYAKEQKQKNYAKRLLAKIPEVWEDDKEVPTLTDVFLMRLNPAKVHRHFGNQS